MGGDPADGGVVVALLGPVEIGPAGGVMTGVPQPRLRVLLGLLGVAAGRVMSAEALVEGVWGEEWSPRREKNLHALVYQLRRRLAVLEPGAGAGCGAGRLTRVGAGYRLALGAGELDVAVFRSLAGRGREAARAGDCIGARELFAEALALWRGPPLADAAPLCARLAGEAARLEDARLAAVEERLECDLALGRHGEVAAELAALAAEFPLRERLTALLMTALYRCGRRGEALAVFDASRRALAAELGLDPGPELAEMQRRVLADDPALAAPALGSATSAPAAVRGAAAVAARVGAVPPEETGVAPQAAVPPEGTGVAPQAAVPPGGAAVVPRQLPAGTGFFAGREAELKELDALLGHAGGGDGDDGDGGPVVISAVAGMAGVGKTTLAVRWARKVANRFPDGQLYVNLRGYDPGAAVTPEEAAGWFLVALGVPAPQIPADPPARFGLYRSVLARRRVLIVLDNAADAGQVRPLVPGGAGCLVIVTSRSSLAGLAAAEGARPLRLSPLPAEEAVRLLAARLGPERVAAEPAAVADLVARCGGLPLALAVMAARAAADPGLPLGLLAGKLAGAAVADGLSAGHDAAGAGPGRLEVLETGDVATSLRELLSWSHRQLSPSAAEMFALLGVHCGPDITVPAAASMAGIAAAAARQALAELAEASLASEHRPGRYVVHDLVRSYAAEHARRALGQGRIRPAIGRSLDHYLHTMVTFLHDVPRPFTPAPPSPGVVPEPLTDTRWLEWAQAEHQVLLQAIAQAAEAGMTTRAWQIFACLASFLGGQGSWADCQAAGQAVLAAGQAAGDHVARGWTHATIGWYGTLTSAGPHGEDRAHQQRALEHFRRAGDLPGQAWAHLFASLACSWKGGDRAEAMMLAEQALALFRQTGDQAGQVWALTGLGNGHARLGNYDLARRYGLLALEVGRTAGDPTNMALAWSALGLVHSRLGEHRQAVDCYRQALTLARERKTPLARRWLAGVLSGFGDACRAADDLPAAYQAWQEALQILHDLGLPENRRIRARIGQADTHR